MATKTISIKEKVYHKLLALKRDNESFSDLLERLVESQNTVIILEQLRGSMDLGDTNELIKEIRKRREEWRQ